jgi:hypothetical protein
LLLSKQNSTLWRWLLSGSGHKGKISGRNDLFCGRLLSRLIGDPAIKAPSVERCAFSNRLDTAMRRPDPELLPVQRPRCPKCQMRMLSVGIDDRPGGFEDHAFECLKCVLTETMHMPADPLKTSVPAGWLSAEHGKPH